MTEMAELLRLVLWVIQVNLACRVGTGAGNVLFNNYTSPSNESWSIVDGFVIDGRPSISPEDWKIKLNKILNKTFNKKYLFNSTSFAIIFLIYDFYLKKKVIYICTYKTHRILKNYVVVVGRLRRNRLDFWLVIQENYVGWPRNMTSSRSIQV